MPTPLFTLSQTSIGSNVTFASVPNPGPIALPANYESLTCSLTMSTANQNKLTNSITWYVYVAPPGPAPTQPPPADGTHGNGWTCIAKEIWTGGTHVDHSGALLTLLRGEKVERKIRLGPNQVHAFITHKDGSITDLGISYNLMTNIGRDLFAQWIGGGIPAGGIGSPATATSATSITSTATPWTASNLATPQLGLAGFRVYASVTGITTPPVYGNIVSNTTSVATIDQWWKGDDTTGTTPAATNAFIIGAGGIGSVRFMALSTNAGAAAAADTTLASEVTTNGGARALATYAHTFGQATMTLQKAYAITGTLTAIHKMGLFCALTTGGADPMVFETVLNADATVANGDSLTVTDTITISG